MSSEIPTLLTTFLFRESRRRLKGYFVAGSQVEKLPALLVESGAVYCAIWVSCIHYTSCSLSRAERHNQVVVVAFQASQYKWWYVQLPPKSPAERRFLDVLAMLMNGAPVPVTVSLFVPILLDSGAHSPPFESC